jgi:hypothetical protein
MNLHLPDEQKRLAIYIFKNYGVFSTKFMIPGRKDCSQPSITHQIPRAHKETPPFPQKISFLPG